VKDWELALQKKDRTPIWCSITAAMQYDEKGDVKWMDGVIEDITERKHAEEALRKAHDELERRVLERTKELSEANIKLKELDRLKSIFLANMSHEIRTPMNGIIGMAELLMDTELSREQQEYLNAVKMSADSLLAVINDILDFSKIEARKLELDSMNFNIRDCIGDTLHALSLRASEKGLELAFEVSPDIPDTMVGDPGRLRQIIINLIGNAVKFTEQGEVVVSISPEALQGDEVHLHFTVADTGIGIPPEKRERIFEAFSQADASTTRKYGGTGLGLTISAGLVEMMGGRIWVESEVGKGSVFHFTAQLELLKSHVVRQIPERLANLQGLPVLVIDDNATNRRILEQILLGWRMKPAVANGALSGLEMMTQARRKGEPFQLLLLDAHMPVIDGFELAEKIKQRPEFNEPIIIMITSSGQRGDGARCRDVGISAYLTKPVKQSSLLDAVTTVLGKIEPAGAQAPLVTCHTLREKQRPLRILLAEDNVVNQKIASSMLTKRGHTVVPAGNGKEAIAALENQGAMPFDLVLMDVQMPEMDGLEATTSIREKENTTGHHIPIIALTAHAMKGARETCLKAGMDSYVTKPLKADELFSAIEDMVSAKAETEGPGGDTLLLDVKTENIFSEEAALASVDGDMDLLKEIVGMFGNEHPIVLSNILIAVNEGNAAMLDRSAHTLKGLVGNFGARNAFEIALKLEMMAKNGNLSGAKEVFASLNKEMERLQNALEKFIGGNNA